MHEPTIDLSALSGRSFGAVLFDNDGTLVDSIAAVEACWQQWAREYGVHPAHITNLHGQPSDVLVAGLVSADRFPAAAARIRQLELEASYPVRVLPGAVAALQATAGRNAIVTSATRALFQHRIEQTGLPAPQLAVTSDDVTRGKPDPEPYLVAASRLGYAPEECLVVEDAPAGVRAGHAAGSAVLGIDSAPDRSMQGEPLRADAVVPDLSFVRFTLHGGAIRVEVAS